MRKLLNGVIGLTVTLALITGFVLTIIGWVATGLNVFMN